MYYVDDSVKDNSIAEAVYSEIYEVVAKRDYKKSVCCSSLLPTREKGEYFEDCSLDFRFLPQNNRETVCDFLVTFTPSMGSLEYHLSWINELLDKNVIYIPGSMGAGVRITSISGKQISLSFFFINKDSEIVMESIFTMLSYIRLLIISNK